MRWTGWLWAALAGCGGVAGEWEGTCLLVVSGYSAPLPISFELEPRGSGIGGSCEIVASGYTVAGTAEGERRGGDVEVACVASFDGYTFRVVVEGAMKGGEIDGTCVYEGSGGGIPGTVKLDRP